MDNKAFPGDAGENQRIGTRGATKKSMTVRDRISKSIADHDRAVEESRIAALANVREPFRDAMDAYESAKALAKESGRIFSHLAQRREAVRNIGLLDYEQTKLQSEQERKHADHK